jgi:hypothetical protein
MGPKKEAIRVSKPPVTKMNAAVASAASAASKTKGAPKARVKREAKQQNKEKKERFQRVVPKTPSINFNSRIAPENLDEELSYHAFNKLARFQPLQPLQTFETLEKIQEKPEVAQMITMSKVEKLYSDICKMNSEDFYSESVKKKAIQKIIETEQEFVHENISNRDVVYQKCFDLSAKYHSNGILVILKDSQDLARPNKIVISVISHQGITIKSLEDAITAELSPLIREQRLVKNENDLSENFSIQVMDPNKESDIYDAQEDCDSQQILTELTNRIIENVSQNASANEGHNPSENELAQRLMEIELLKGQSSRYLIIPQTNKVKMEELSVDEINSLRSTFSIDEDTVAELMKKHEVGLEKLSNSHSQLSEGKPFKINYNLKSKCDDPNLFISCAKKILISPYFFKMFSTVFAWCGKATLKSCDESVNAMRTLFTEYSNTKTQDFLDCCKLLLELKIEGSQIFLKTMYKEFPSQMIYKILLSLKQKPKSIFYGLTGMDMSTFLSTGAHCGTSESTIRAVSLKITNDTEFSGGGKKMKGGAIDFDIEYLFSIYLNGVVSLFTRHMPGGVPINDLLSQFIIDLNIYGRDNNYSWISSQVGGGAQSCYRIGKKADFDARVYLINSTYEQLLLHIIGVETGIERNQYGGGTLSNINNYIHDQGRSYFNPDGYKFVFDEYTFCVFFDRTQIRQHKPEGGKFPVRLISIDIVWKVDIYKNEDVTQPIGCYYHYSGIFDLVVKNNKHISDKIEKISIGKITEKDVEDFRYFSMAITSSQRILDYFANLIVVNPDIKSKIENAMENDIEAFLKSESALNEFVKIIIASELHRDYINAAFAQHPADFPEINEIDVNDFPKKIKYFITTVGPNDELVIKYIDFASKFKEFIKLDIIKAITWFCEAIANNNELFQKYYEIMQLAIQTIYSNKEDLKIFSDMIAGHYCEWKFKDCIIDPYGEKGYCPIYSMSCLVETIIETLDDLLNVLNRINTLKFIKDFNRLIDICDLLIELCKKYNEIFDQDIIDDITLIKQIFVIFKEDIFSTQSTIDHFNKYASARGENEEGKSVVYSFLLEKGMPHDKIGYIENVDMTPKELIVSNIYLLIEIMREKIKITEGEKVVREITLDEIWHSEIVSNVTVDPHARHKMLEINADKTPVIVIKNDFAISIYVSWLYYDHINRITLSDAVDLASISVISSESYPEYSGLLKRMLQIVHENSVASSKENSSASSSANATESNTQEYNYGTVFSPFRVAAPISRQSSGYGATASSGGPGDRWGGGNKKTRKYLKKANSKKSRKQRKSKKHVSKSNRKTKRK